MVLGAIFVPGAGWELKKIASWVPFESPWGSLWVTLGSLRITLGSFWVASGPQGRLRVPSCSNLNRLGSISMSFLNVSESFVVNVASRLHLKMTKNEQPSTEQKCIGKMFQVVLNMFASILNFDILLPNGRRGGMRGANN